jgi:hypothetical protein
MGFFGPWHCVLGAPLAYPWRKKAKLLEVERRDATAHFGYSELCFVCCVFCVVPLWFVVEVKHPLAKAKTKDL